MLPLQVEKKKKSASGTTVKNFQAKARRIKLPRKKHRALLYYLISTHYLELAVEVGSHSDDAQVFPSGSV
jgi:hypothetical protein